MLIASLVYVGTGLVGGVACGYNGRRHFAAKYIFCKLIKTLLVSLIKTHKQTHLILCIGRSRYCKCMDDSFNCPARPAFVTANHLPRSLAEPAELSAVVVSFPSYSLALAFALAASHTTTHAAPFHSSCECSKTTVLGSAPLSPK